MDSRCSSSLKVWCWWSFHVCSVFTDYYIIIDIPSYISLSILEGSVCRDKMDSLRNKHVHYIITTPVLSL